MKFQTFEDHCDLLYYCYFINIIHVSIHIYVHMYIVDTVFKFYDLFEMKTRNSKS